MNYNLEEKVFIEYLHDGYILEADFYDIVGVTGSFTDGKYGWTELVGASIRRVRHGYLINLPKTREQHY